MNLAELLTIPAGMFPDTEIITSAESRMTYAELEARVTASIESLRRHGVSEGDRVAVLNVNTPSMIEALYACAALGAVFVPLNFRARDHELSHMISLAEPKLILCGTHYLPAAQRAAAESNIPVFDAAGFIQAGEPAESPVPVEVDDRTLAVLMFTSGTTAAAKAAMLAHADLVNFVLAMSELATGDDAGAVLIAAPLYHIAGLTAVLTATWAGRRMVLMPQFNPGEWLRLVEAEAITHAFLVPTMMKRVLDRPEFATANLRSLQVLSYGGAPMPIGVIKRAIAAFPTEVQFINAFGQTETTSTVTALGPEDHRLTGDPSADEAIVRRLGSIGRPVGDVEVAVVDELGQTLPAGSVGEITIRTERSMRGYYRQEDATTATLRDGWLHTRDLGWIDEGGYVFLAGRKSDLIIRGGENIAPEEVEVVLESHPAVTEAAVFGIPSEEWGEIVGAAIVTEQPTDELKAELLEFCRARLGGYKTPAKLIFLDTLPRSELGKLLRRELRARFDPQPAGSD